MGMMPNPYSRYGYRPTGDTGAMLRSTNDATRQQGENAAFYFGREYDQQEHEKNLQAQEQQRRQYDSETARMGQDKKYGLLGGLLRGF
jgi:hypothetical protein